MLITLLSHPSIYITYHGQCHGSITIEDIYFARPPLFIPYFGKTSIQSHTHLSQKQYF